MAFEYKRIARQKVRYNDANDDNPLVHQLIINGAKVDPTSATIGIYHSGDADTEILASLSLSTAMETSTDRGDSDTSLLTYAVDTTTTASWPVGRGYRADIVVTYNSITYPQHFLFDVVKYVLTPKIGFDQLVAYEDRVRGMTHDGDPDFSNMIGACQDNWQAKIETKMTEAGRMQQEMLIDDSMVQIAFRSYVLAKILREPHPDLATDYMDEANVLFDAALAVQPLDTGQSGFEDGTDGELVDTVLEL